MPRWPKYVELRAQELRAKLESGQIKARRAMHVDNVQVVDIGKRWRLVSVDGGDTFNVMSHEKYNRTVSKCCQ